MKSFLYVKNDVIIWRRKIIRFYNIKNYSLQVLLRSSILFKQINNHLDLI